MGVLQQYERKRPVLIFELQDARRVMTGAVTAVRSSHPGLGALFASELAPSRLIIFTSYSSA